MKALVYKGPGLKSFEEHDKPEIRDPTDAIVRITKTTICGTDLHILRATSPPAHRAGSSAMKAWGSSMRWVRR